MLFLRHYVPHLTLIKMTVTEVMLKIYDGLLSRKDESGIPVRLRAKSTIGTVQDDPFDCWVEEAVRAVLSPGFDVYHSGALMEKARSDTGKCTHTPTP